MQFLASLSLMSGGGPMFPTIPGESERTSANKIIEGSSTFNKYRNENSRARKLRGGCKVFMIEGEEIVALNEKNAQRKYNNLVKERQANGHE